MRLARLPEELRLEIARGVRCGAEESAHLALSLRSLVKTVGMLRAAGIGSLVFRAGLDEGSIRLAGDRDRHAQADHRQSSDAAQRTGPTRWTGQPALGLASGQSPGTVGD